jgi:hypothetical protein
MEHLVNLSPRAIAALCATGLVLVLVASCRQDQTLAFTKAPPRTAFKIEPKALLTGVFTGVPIDPQVALSAAEAALPARIARVNEVVVNAACGQRVKEIECANGKIEGEIVRNGPIELTAQEGRLLIKVPLTYTLTMRGQGWARAIEETKTGAITATSQIDSVLQAGYVLELTAAETWGLSDRTTAFGKAQFDTTRYIQAKLQTVTVAFTSKLADEIAAAPILASGQKTWRALHQPFQIANSPELWIAGDPQRIGGAGFHQDGSRLFYQMAIGLRASLHDVRPPAPLSRANGPKKLPEPSRATPDMLTTQLRLPFLLAMPRLQSAAARAFPVKERLTSQADRFIEAVDVTTRQARVYPSQRQLVLELDLDVLAPKAWAGRKGHLHLLGRPVLDSARDIVLLDSITLPVVSSRGIKDTKDTAPPPQLQLGAEPFAGRLAAGFKVDIAQDVRNVVAQANAGLERQLDEGIAMSARFDGGQAVGVEPVDDGLSVIVQLSGRILLQPDSTLSAATTSGEQIPTRNTVGAAPKRPVSPR